MRKLLITDLDGTLLLKNGTISTFTKETIEKAYRDEKIHFAISTGRALFSAKMFASFFNIPVIVSSFNGALVEIDNKIVHSHPLTFNEADIIAKVLSRFNQVSIAFCRNTYFMEEDNADYKRQGEIYKTNGIICPFSTMAKYAEENDITIYKFLVKHVDKDMQDKIVNELLKEDIDLVFSTSSSTTLEIMPKGIGKDTSVRLIANHLNLDKEDIIAFGDWDNDIPLLSEAGLPICMKNGSDNLKKIARLIADDNESDGLAKMLIQIL